MADPAPIPTPTLYCPNCGYNLTGLNRQVCPECDTPFDPVELARRNLVQRPHFIGGVLYILIAPILFGIGSWIGFANHSSIPDSVFQGGAIVLLFAAAATSIIAGRRLARRVARKYPHDPITPATVLMTLVFGGMFFVFQSVLAGFLFFVSCCAYFKP